MRRGSTIWAATATPAVAATPIRRRSNSASNSAPNANGYISGVRFYKGQRQHAAPTWASCGAAAGQLLAIGDLHQRDGDGLAAGQLRHPGGDHRQHRLRGLVPRARWDGTAIEQQLLRTPGVTNGPLYALRDGESGGNGVYLYGAGSVPDQHLPVQQLLGGRGLHHQHRSRHDAADGDRDIAASGATGVNPANPVTATFSEAMDPATITTSHSSCGMRRARWSPPR